ncbi:MAG: chorismate-binding protein [Candidatus Omnitrophica bacterium]|nr:chorismate-binding protein [Candidatus Omnitrophota bacterium]
MIRPSLPEFIQLAGKSNVIPIYKEVSADLDTPVSSFLKLHKDEYAFLLESVEGREKIARYSFLGTRPSLVFRSKGNLIEINCRDKSACACLSLCGSEKDHCSFKTDSDPLAVIEKLMSGFKPAQVPGLPRFYGGLVGFMGYDCVRFFEKLPDKNPDDLKLPDSVFILTETILLFDHINHTIKIVSNCFLPQYGKKLTQGVAKKVYEQALKKIRAIEDDLARPLSGKGIEVRKSAPKIKITSNFEKSAFCGIVNKAKRHIQKGDIIQVVLSQRFKARIQERGKDETQDRALEVELLNDAKEKAEHLMLVDQGRNDIGRVCRIGSIKVDDFMFVERYSHVMHIVSEVSGVLDRKNNAFDVLRACFPAGTVSGSPKVRAMEIIDELENSRRGPYAGSVGYFSFSGNLDTCITIRTICVKGNTAYIQVGAGIVADSRGKNEYNETVNKAKALFEAITK